MRNIFNRQEASEFVDRINILTSSTRPHWGTMSAAQMMAHCNVMFEMIYEPEKHKRPNRVMRFFLRAFLKNSVCGVKPYPKNSKTAPQFLITDAKAFNEEKARLVTYLEKTLNLGAEHFDGKDYFSFGKLTKTEWNNMISKHLDHHLTQFGV